MTLCKISGDPSAFEGAAPPGAGVVMLQISASTPELLSSHMVQLAYGFKGD